MFYIQNQQIIVTVVILNFHWRNAICNYKMSHYWEKGLFLFWIEIDFWKSTCVSLSLKKNVKKQEIVAPRITFGFQTRLVTTWKNLKQKIVTPFVRNVEKWPNRKGIRSYKTSQRTFRNFLFAYHWPICSNETIARQNNIHCEKYRNFTKFLGVEILWKDTVSTPGNQEKLRYFS